MKLKIYKALAAGTMVLVTGIAASAFAQGVYVNTSASATVTTGGTGIGVGIGASVSARIATIIQNAQSRADQEITRRVNALNALSTRINGMVKVSSDEKSSLSSTIQSQITLMNNLQAQISADASADSTSSLKFDIQSITKSYRVFMLIIPQGAIDAAGDRVLDVSGLLQTLAGKLQTRISAAQSGGTDMSASVAALADMNAKITDATTQEEAATSEIAGLQPDNGVQSVMESNTATLKDARTKIQAAQQDLITARQDAGVIIKALVALNASASGSAAASTTAQ